MVKVRSHGFGVKVWVMIGDHKVGGQGQGIGHGVKSGEGSRLEGPSRRSRPGEGSRFGRQGLGSRSGVKVVGSRSWS